MDFLIGQTDQKRREENIDRLDAESILLLCVCEAQFAQDKAKDE